MMKYIPLTKTVGIEIVLCRHRWDIVPILHIEWGIKPKSMDHRGMYFLLAIWRMQFEFNIASCRHAKQEENNDVKD